jgi:hypothetical protein
VASRLTPERAQNGILYGDQMLMAYCSARALLRALTRGFTPSTAVSAANYAFSTSMNLRLDEKLKQGPRICVWAYRSLLHAHNWEGLGHVANAIAVTLQMLSTREHIESIVQSGLESAIKTHNLVDACYCAGHWVANSLSHGRPFQEWIRRASDLKKLIRPFNHPPMISYIEVMERTAEILSANQSIDRSSYDAEMLRRHEEVQSLGPVAQLSYWMTHTTVLYVHGVYERDKERERPCVMVCA